MKIIGIRNVTGRELPQQVYLMADSSVIKTNKPFFVPHFATRFVATPAIVLHVGRLGKHIASRFAHRYCDAVAPAVKVTAAGITGMEHEQEQASALALSFDGALLLGDAFPASEVNIDRCLMDVLLNDTSFTAPSLEQLGTSYEGLIAQLSVFFTLKMGDMIVIELNHQGHQLHPGDTLHASLNSRQSLTIRVK